MMTIMDNKRNYEVAIHLHFAIEAETVEEAFQIAFNDLKDAIHYKGETSQCARVQVSGTEDEIEATLEAEWKNGLLFRVNTEREVF